MTAAAHAMFAERTRRRLRSPVMYGNRHHEAAAWPELRAWLDWLTAGKKAARTRTAYEMDCAKLLLAHPDVPFTEFTDAHLLALLASWPERSRHINKVSLNGWFKWGYKTRRLQSNPADLLPDIRYRPTRNIKVFTGAEEAALRGLPAPHGRLMTVLLETGIRRSEARLLTVRRVNFEAQELLVREGVKGGPEKERLVDLTVPAAAAFHELIVLDGLGPHDHFWSCHPGGSARPRRRDMPIANTTFQRWWKLCLAEAGVAYRKVHTTRHSFATYWLDRIDDGEVQRLLGHESIVTTRDTYDQRGRTKTGPRMRQFDESDRTGIPPTRITMGAPAIR